MLSLQRRVASLPSRRISAPQVGYTMFVIYPVELKDGVMAEDPTHDAERRDFLITTTCCLGAAGVAAASWPFINSMIPTVAVRVEANTTVELNGIDSGAEHTDTKHSKPKNKKQHTPEENTAMEAS